LDSIRAFLILKDGSTIHCNSVPFVDYARNIDERGPHGFIDRSAFEELFQLHCECSCDWTNECGDDQTEG